MKLSCGVAVSKKKYSKEKQLTNQLTNLFGISKLYMCFQHVRHIEEKITTKPIGQSSAMIASRIALEKLVLPTCANLNFRTNVWKTFHAEEEWIRMVFP